MPMKPFTFPALFLLILFVSSCKSPLSDGNVEELSSICAKIEVYQSLLNKKDNRIKVSLYDDDSKPIVNKEISIMVNGIVLDTVQTKGLYYTTSNYYAKQNISVGEMYTFEIVLTDKKKYLLGSVKPIEESKENTISLPDKGNFDEDMVLSWHHLKEVNELSISKSVLLKTSTELEMNYGYETTLERKIGDEGKYVFPKSSFITSKSIISGIELKFTALKFGEMNKDLLKGSEIKISGDLNKYVDFDEENKISK